MVEVTVRTPARTYAVVVGAGVLARADDLDEELHRREQAGRRVPMRVAGEAFAVA